VQTAEQILYKILSGKTKCEIDGKVYYIYCPTIDDLYEAELIHQKYIEETKFVNILVNNSPKLINYLSENLYWIAEEQQELDIIVDKINNTKIALYEAYVEFRNKTNIQTNLLYLKSRYSTLLYKKNKFYLYTNEGFAELYKQYYLIYRCSILKEQGRFDDIDYNLVEQLYEQYQSQYTNGDKIRKLSRNQIWRLYQGGASDCQGVFGKPTLQLTIEQLSLWNWSKFYENIHQSMDCPTQEVIDNDDMLDGWALLQSKKREKEKQKTNIDDKMGNSQEVFLLADNQDDIKRINELNDNTSKLIKTQRANKITKEGVVEDQNFTDVRLMRR
jgi:hypothetical protein